MANRETIQFAVIKNYITHERKQYFTDCIRMQYDENKLDLVTKLLLKTEWIVSNKALQDQTIRVSTGFLRPTHLIYKAARYRDSIRYMSASVIIFICSWDC